RKQRGLRLQDGRGGGRRSLRRQGSRRVWIPAERQHRYPQQLRLADGALGRSQRDLHLRRQQQVHALPMRSVRHAVSALALLGGSLATASSARALGRTAADANEVAILRQRSPQAAELLERGEARAL